MKILIIGSGGREHALSWKLSQSKLVDALFIAPGNAGTLKHGMNVPIKSDDIKGLKDFVLKEGIDLTVVGPELPLTLGIVDEFIDAGLKIFGPTKAAARLESSKVFSKEFMVRYGIKTAEFKRFSDAEEARAYVRAKHPPFVVKADGLASGKGVVIANTTEEAEDAIRLIMEEKAFADAGDKVVIEEFLTGEEASFIAITDGKTVCPLASSQDHKRIFDGDKGPNTGGMGAYSPAPIVTKDVEKEVLSTVMVPLIKGMEKEGAPYKGFIYAGLMIKHGRPYVLEFNCRLGDPEAQPILMRLKTDLAEVLVNALEGRLDGVNLQWDFRPAVCVVMAEKGYPGAYEKDKEIKGFDEVAAMKDVFVFHAGTEKKNNKTITAGGRVLGVTGMGKTIKDAIKNTYNAVEKISWEGAYYRNDIGKRALKR